ncbi:uncharacterized protein LOC115194387 [Salmo trutta]|uniref:uncharacterized protein LOC115194387 n=1 Tax=Salmo trutta TaxID=8032 RepID=UPI0011310EDB|nr:uncharacterized protein LOC115194387 [Salmo trutta]
MDNTLLCVLLLLSILIYCGHCGEDDALPKASVRISPQGLLYSGDTVTLLCDIPDDTDWTYHWSRNNQTGSSTHGKTIYISLPDHADQYQCWGTREDQPQKSQLSRVLSIQLTALPTASVRVSPQGLLYSGDTVTLQCDIPDYTDWMYYWYRNNQQLSSQTSETITISLPDQAGQYQCRGKRTTRPQSSNLSSSLPITVTGELFSIWTFSSLSQCGFILLNTDMHTVNSN